MFFQAVPGGRDNHSLLPIGGSTNRPVPIGEFNCQKIANNYNMLFIFTPNNICRTRRR